MVNKKAFTLIELMLVIIVASILSLGTMIALKEIYLKSLKVKQMTLLSLDSQIIVDKIAAMLYDRVPSSALGYDPLSANFKSIYEILDSDNMKIFEWIGEDIDLKNSQAYSGFIDFEKSISTTNSLRSPDINATTLNLHKNDLGLIFTSSYEMGDEIIGTIDTFKKSFGWHGNLFNEINEIYKINNFTGSNIIINLTTHPNPNKIFEKYYLVNSAYAIARGEDLNIANFKHCTNLAFNLNDISNFKNSLFLFFDYRPWQNETFCADSNILGTEARSGSVMILGENVSGFNMFITPSNELKFNITMQNDTRGSEQNVTISKQKIVL